MEPEINVVLTQAELQALAGLLQLSAPLAGIEGAKMAGRLHLKVEQAVARFNAAQQAPADHKTGKKP